MRNVITPLFKRGYLSHTAETVFRGEKLESYQRLDMGKLKQIATVLGHLAKEHDLYELLFESPAQTLEVDGKEIYTPDLTLFVLLDWTHQRGYFIKYSNGNAMSDTEFARSVPLALEGARRVFNKPYMSWLDEDNPIRHDIFLPAGLASYEPDGDGGSKPRQKGKLGVALLRKHLSDVEITPEVVWELRDIIGPQWPAKRLPRLLKKTEFKQLPGNLGQVWNNVDHLCRCMLAQTWIFKHPSRHPNMITDFMDWDNYQVGVDADSELAAGIKPRDTLPDGILSMTKFKPKNIVKPEEPKIEENPYPEEENLTL